LHRRRRRRSPLHVLTSGASALERGRRLAEALAGAWRAPAPPWQPSPAELSAVVPLLLAAGCGALGWWRLRAGSGLTPPPDGPAEPLHAAYRMHALQGAIHEQQISRVVPVLREAGVEPLLVKGWAATPLYPEPGLRPYGDIDLLVRPEQHTVAREALVAGAPAPVDLHCGLADLDDHELEDVFARSRLVSLRDVDVRVPSAEDHLRLLCLHALRHGVSRALWLCDIAAALEGRPPAFDWDRLLAGNPRRSEAVVAALGLARAVLGAEPGTTPVAVRAERLPRWLVPATLRQWGKGSGLREPMGSFLRHPRGALTELRKHWPNPIEGTMGVGAPWNAWPRLPFQVTHVLVRAARFARGLPAFLYPAAPRDSSSKRQPSSSRCSRLWARGAPAPGSPGTNLNCPRSHARKA
jgi:hypothetical protein